MSGSDSNRWKARGYSDEEANSITLFLKNEKLRLLRETASTKQAGPNGRLNQKRFVREQVRKKLKQFYDYEPLRIPPLLMASRLKENALLEGFLPNRQKLWRPIMQRKLLDTMPEVNLKDFSFVHNAPMTANMLTEILEIEATHLRARLNFDDLRCNDIGAFLVLQAVREYMAPVFQSGRISNNMQKVIDAVGLRAPLQMAPFEVDHRDVWPFHLQQRRGGNANSANANRQIQPQRKEMIADRFVGAVNDWLSVVANQMLARQGKRRLVKIIGEALDNAERHSLPGSDDGDWAIAGYLAREVESFRSVFNLYVALLSVGSSIATSIAGCPPTTRLRMDEYVRRHRGHRMGEEQLRTVFALQDGVTRSREAWEGGRGGTGLQDIFEFFADLGDAKLPGRHSRLAVVSGSTCINLGGPYMKGERRSGRDSERELWFNQANDPKFGPDPKHVLQIPGTLNGTLVTMAIPLDREYLEATAHEQQDDDQD